MRNIKTSFHLSYNKIYGNVDFTGSRIVRTYSDDNISAGYNVNFPIKGALRAELGAGLGVSFIDKIEYEQKPVWQGAAQVYEDYTLSNFDIDPTSSYQATGKLMLTLPYNFQLFGGATYRSQFASQLTSPQTMRENTLEKFADLQVVLGFRYNINH